MRKRRKQEQSKQIQELVEETVLQDHMSGSRIYAIGINIDHGQRLFCVAPLEQKNIKLL